MSFPPYLDCQDSRMNSIGNIPSHWSMKRLKDVATHNDDALGDDTPEDADFLYVDISSVNTEQGIHTKEEVVFRDAPSRARRCVQDGDVIVSTVRTYLKAIARVIEPEENLIVSTGFAVIRPSEELESNFAGNLLLSQYFIDEVISRSTGVSYPAINASDLVRISVPVPPLAEQKAISSFLDVETSKIDGLVSEQRRLIELLKEKRQAVISHAVTKGLNPNAPMKPSGIQWLGDVPQHWDMTRLKYLVIADRGIQMGPFGGMLKELEETPTPFKLYGQQNTINDDFEVGSRWLSEDRFTALREYELLPHDVVLTRKGASIGHCRLVPENIHKGVIDSDTIRVRLNLEQLTVAFAVLLMHEGYLEKEILNKQKGSVLPGLNTGTIANLRIALPPIEEQKDICGYTEHFGGQILSLIAEAERAIELLQECRTALISAAVTGKIDVREFAYQETA